MKILLINDSLIRGGKERRMIELIKGLLAKETVAVELILLSDVIDYPEIHDLDIPLHILIRKPKKDPRVAYRIYKIARRFNPDIMHCWSSMATMFSIPAAKAIGAKLINANIACKIRWFLIAWTKIIFKPWNRLYKSTITKLLKKAIQNNKSLTT